MKKKTLISKDSRISKYIFENDTVVDIKSDKVITPNFIIGDMNSSNAELVFEVTPPAEWIGCKYICNEDKNFTLNPDYTEPEED